MRGRRVPVTPGVLSGEVRHGWREVALAAAGYLVLGALAVGLELAWVKGW